MSSTPLECLMLPYFRKPKTRLTGNPRSKSKFAGKFIEFFPISNYHIPSLKSLGLHYKTTGDIRLVKQVLEQAGLSQSKANWSVFWSTGPIRSNLYSTLERHQKVNHFPHSNEITKKDSLFKNVAKMQTMHGTRNFAFIPETYALPGETPQLSERMRMNKDALWIVKPAGKSQGKGIYLTTSPEELPTSGSYVVCKYIPNPFLIDGLKFDLRIYVAITSIHPLRIYMYKEGLVRFATELYSSLHTSRFAHLTNYSVNKRSAKFTVSAEGPKGHKWALSTLRSYLADKNIQFDVIWSSMRDIVVKTILSIESKISAAAQMYVPYRTNCFELLGFDILLDDALTPWLLEVNLSPSLSTDSLVDVKVKSALISDLFNLIGVSKKPGHPESAQKKPKPAWNGSTVVDQGAELTVNALNIIRETQAELQRTGSFQRVFPSELSFLYRNYFEEERPYNSLVAGELGRMKKQGSFAKQFTGNVYKQNIPVPKLKRRRTGTTQCRT